MAKKKTTKKAASSSAATTRPKFPYSTKPNSLRRFLESVPQKPKPPKVNSATLKAWGLRDTNDQTIIRVLKALAFIDASGAPTDRYTEFMSPGKGPTVLAVAVREVWAPLFDHSHEPQREDDTTLRNYFNIHSGGSENTISLQIQTFKAACDHADFAAQPGDLVTDSVSAPAVAAPSAIRGSQPAIHIDLHIHLPENKSRRDYEYIFEDIARYIFGRDVGGSGDRG